MRGRILLGMAFVTFGVLWLLDAVGVLAYDVWGTIGTWWPTILIVIGLVQLATGSRIGGAVLLGLGVIFLLDELDAIPADAWDVIWPLALIVLGLWFLASVFTGGGSRPRRRRRADGKRSKENVVDRTVLFGGFDQQVDAPAFRNGTITVVFGGGDLDLRGSTLAEAGADVEVTVLFGGVDIIVPDDWRVEVRGTPIFGAWSDERRRNDAAEPVGPVLTVRGTALFGGVGVKSKRD